VRYLISGYYGEGNAGDEAILTGILGELGRHDPQARFTVLSFDPADTERRHGVEALSTSLRDPVRLAEVMRASDLLISGGGSFLHEADFALYGHSFLLRQGRLRPVPYFLSVVLLAQLLRLPVFWYAQGLGPLHTRTARRLIALLGSRSAAVTWRDPDSARLAAAIGVRCPLERVVPDPAFALMPAADEPVDALLRREGLPAGDFVAVCPRPWLDHTAYQDALAGAVAAATRERDLPVLLVPFQPRTDGPLCADLARHPALAGVARLLPAVEDPALLAGVLGRATAAVTMRLHAGILAAVAGTPAVAVDYDPKVRAFARLTGQELWAVTVADLEGPGGADRLREVLNDTLDRHSERRARLERAVAPLRAAAAGTARLAVQVAAREGGR